MEIDDFPNYGQHRYSHFPVHFSDKFNFWTLPEARVASSGAAIRLNHGPGQK
jgi:hypothetical protein